MPRITISVSTFDEEQDIEDAMELLHIAKRMAKRNDERTKAYLSMQPASYGEKVGIAPAGSTDEKPVAVVVAKAVSGEDLRKAAAEKAKQIGPDRVKEFIKSLGVKSIVEVAPEDAPGVLQRLQALE